MCEAIRSLRPDDEFGLCTRARAPSWRVDMAFSTDRAGGFAVVVDVVRLATLALGLSAACDRVSSLAPDPYENLKDETVGLGAIDPIAYPPANLGQGGDRTKPGIGAF